MGHARQWKENDGGEGANILSLEEDDFGDEEKEDGDFFNACLNRTLEAQEAQAASSSTAVYMPVVANAKTLLNLRREEVFVCR